MTQAQTQTQTILAIAFSKKSVGIILAALGLACFLAFYFLIDIARILDARSLAQTTSFVHFAVEQRQKALARTAVDYADWGEAYRHLYLKVDPHWAFEEDNFGPSLQKQLGVEFAGVFDRDGHEVYGVANSEKRAVSSLLGGGLQDLIAAARKDTDNVAKGVLIADGRPVLAVARVITPGLDVTVERDGLAPSVLVLADELTDPETAQLRQALHLTSLRFNLAEPAQATDRIILSATDGSKVFLTEFATPDFGTELVQAIIPTFLLVAMAFGALVASLGREGLREAAAVSKLQQHLQQQAHYDAVTGLPNRVMFSERLLETAKLSDYIPAVLFLDLDRFKQVNDLLGHEVGDFVLREVAQRLQTCLGPEDMCARLGGDEFVIIALGYDDVAIQRLCRRILQVISTGINYDDRQITVGISIGGTRVCGSTDTLEDVLRRADKALYAAKIGGRMTFRSYEDLESPVRASA